MPPLTPCALLLAGLLLITGCGGGAEPAGASGATAAADDCAIYATVLRAPEMPGDDLPPLVTEYPGWTGAPDRKGWDAQFDEDAPAVRSHLMEHFKALSDQQVRSLQAAQRRALAEGHRLSCDWARLKPGLQTTPGVDAGAPSTTLSKPARTSDGRFALVEVGTLWGPLNGQGLHCLVEKTRGGWRHRGCALSWIS